MKSFALLAVALAAAALTHSARADVLDVKVTGIVDAQIDSGLAVGDAVIGEFVFDTASLKFSSFTVGGRSVAPGFTSAADITPDLYSALYKAQVSPVQGGTQNSTFAVDLESLTGWPSNVATALLSNASQLATNLDTTFSSFGYYVANADGTGVHRLDAVLGAIQVSVVPEPTSTTLLLAGMATFGLRRAVQRRRG